LDDTDPRVLDAKEFLSLSPNSLNSVSLADVARALLIIFFVCRAKSASW
jgi:hypothetical protein